MNNPREYGYGDSPEVEGSPKIIDKMKEPCPHCGGLTLFGIQVEVKGVALLGGGNGIGTYIGCAACQFASPMMTRKK